FFSKYPEFEYNISEPYLDEFQRMKNITNWKKLSFKKARKGIKIAAIRQFTDLYGVKKDDLHNLHNLFAVIGVIYASKDVDVCQWDMNNNYFVNICDLVDTPMTRIKIERFRTELELSIYTREHKKIFPGPGKEGSELINLLRRQILNPRTSVLLSSPPNVNV
ncbi:hypothetical protein BDV93DRAFT_462258, partial [Ceratobasidium sp. AG-I]